MWGRYWARRYWTRRYWPGPGIVPKPPEPHRGGRTVVIRDKRDEEEFWVLFT
jgi:hypothetical protein